MTGGVGGGGEGKAVKAIARDRKPKAWDEKRERDEEVLSVFIE